MLKSLTTHAEKRNLTLFAHIEGDFISLRDAISLGITGVEHIKNLFLAVYNQTPEAYQIGVYKNDQHDWQQREFDIFSAVPVSSPKMVELISLMKGKNVNVTPTLAICADIVNRHIHLSKASGDKKSTDETSRIFLSGYKALGLLLLRLHTGGIQIQLGSDIVEPGRTILGEMFLMHSAGLDPEDILIFASYNGASALAIREQVGPLSVGKKADFIVFEKDPHEHFLSIKGEKSRI